MTILIFYFYKNLISKFLIYVNVLLLYDHSIHYNRREQAQRSNSSLDHEDDVHMPSITERIFHMATKLEETKSCPITPKSRSGTTTPKLSSIFR